MKPRQQKYLDIKPPQKSLPLLATPAKHLPAWVSPVAIVLGAVLAVVPALSAFEARVLNVTATIINIDPPILTIPGDVGWNVLLGGFDLSGSHLVQITAPDVDATHIFYDFAAGSNRFSFPDPVCGGPFGGPKSVPQMVQINTSTVIKAIACDGAGSGAHYSVVNTKIYFFCATEPRRDGDDREREREHHEERDIRDGCPEPTPPPPSPEPPHEEPEHPDEPHIPPPPSEEEHHGSDEEDHREIPEEEEQDHEHEPEIIREENSDGIQEPADLIEHESSKSEEPEIRIEHEEPLVEDIPREEHSKEI